MAGSPAVGEEEGGPDRPDDWLLNQRAFPDENIPPGAYQDAIEQARELRASRRGTPSSARGDWALAGPTNIGGRVTDIAVDSDEPDTVYAAAATGCVWKSTDSGSTFARAWPEDLGQSMGALVAAPDGTLFAGTGEANPGGGSIVYPGSGVYRSIDGARTWQPVGLADSGSIDRR
ncbi:MAG: WD40/YVTN/BNR-like repeat-containing protein [Carbonactinosporaceae bacterium]